MKKTIAAALLFMSILSMQPAYADSAKSGGVSLDGIAGFLEGRARGTLCEKLRANASSWASDAIAKALAEAGRKSAAEALSNGDVARAVKSELRARAIEWLPGAIEAFLSDELLGGAAGDEARDELREIAGRAMERLKEGIAEAADELAGRWYESAVDLLRREALGRSGGIVDVTRLRASIDRAFDLGTLGALAERALAAKVGDAAAEGIRGRIEDAFGGRLPPELSDALRRGPEELSRVSSRLVEMLPGEKLNAIENSILNRPVVELPTPAYAAILAASAAGHYARAYNGVTVDPWELKRAVEVTRVMLWQIENKDRISLSILQLSSIARDLAASVGAGDALDGAIDALAEPLDRIRSIANQIDELAMKPIAAVRERVVELSKKIEGELVALQSRLLAPIRRGIDGVEGQLGAVADAISEKLPEGFDGVPATWEELKAKLGAVAPGTGASPGPEPSIPDKERVPATNAPDASELDPVYLHSGEFVQRVADLVIPGRGLDLRFVRIYRGMSDFMGEFGHRWTHSYAERLMPREDGIVYVDDRGLKFLFAREGETETPMQDAAE